MSQAQRRRAGGDIKTKVLDELRFLRNWIGNPLTPGAVAP